MKIGTKVHATTVRGTQRDGKITAIHPTKKGNWYEIKPDDGKENYRTRLKNLTAK